MRRGISLPVVQILRRETLAALTLRNRARLNLRNLCDLASLRAIFYMANETNLTERKLVRDLMTVGVPTCPPHTPIVDLTRLMLEKNWEAVVVLDGEEGHALGVVSQDEIGEGV